MKKLIVGLIAAFLMAGGLVTVSSSSATAACPYSGCVDTRTKATDKHLSRKTVKFTVKVKAVGSNATPKGSVQLKVFKNGNVKYSRTKVLTDGKAVFTKSFNRGHYNYTAKYQKKADSRFRNSGDTGIFNVHKKKKHRR